MWLLENKEAFEGRRLWLRPGKTYLFGRTAAEPGQLAISHNTISRKHLTITVHDVEAGHAHNVSKRSKITIEDLATKIGTVVNGQRIKGSKHVDQTEEYEITMGKCQNKFRLKWYPAVFSFSFTNKELQAQPLASLQSRFEQLDIKLLIDYSIQWTTHVISKKRNTAKGLQALINGKYIVTETFLDAIASAAEPTGEGDGAASCALEQDFDRHWPNAIEHLPPRGGEPVQHPDLIYAPDPERKDVFDGYTFIFYDQTQHNNLLAPITNGSGKALLHTVNPGETEVDDFVRYVKEMAGEKGLGSFEDGSEGKGVVLVRYLPAKADGDLINWYTEFITAVSLRLDLRPIEQNEFLEAILTDDAGKLRRPLEMESAAGTQETRPFENSQRVSAPQSSRGSQATPVALEPSQESPPGPRRGRSRKPVRRRFAGFDDDDDDDIEAADPPPQAPAARQIQARQIRTQEEESGLFVSQEPVHEELESENIGGRSQRKRPASPLPEDDLMEGMNPAVAKFKRQRIERGESFAAPSPEPEEEPETPKPPKTQPKKAKQELDVLAVAAKNREKAEARARAEQEDLANVPDDIDLAEIRRLNIVEEMDVRAAGRTIQRTRDREIADGRWNPKWNGVKDFKKFRRRGEATGRQPARVIVALTEVKNKQFGVGDNYWLEDEGSQRKKASASDPLVQERQQSPEPPAPSPRKRRRPAVASESSDEDVDPETAVRPEQPSSKAALRRSGTRSQGSTRSTASGRQTQASQGKRAAQEPVAAGDLPPAKRARPAAPKTIEIVDSDDSDDELKFRFGKRR